MGFDGGTLHAGRVGLTHGALASLVGGCASLDARPDLERSAASVEQAVGVPGELLLLDAQAAARKTETLLADGVTADEAVQVALLNNPRVRAAMLSIGVSRADFVQSTLFTNPVLTLSLRLPDGGGLAHFGAEFAQNIAESWLIPARRLAAERELLPENSHAEIAPITSITGEIMLLALSSPDGSVSDLDLRAYAEFDLRNRLLAVPGVAQVSPIGGALSEYQVNVRQDRLALYGLTVGNVVEAARGAHGAAPAGYLPNVDGQEFPIRQAARVRSVADIANTLIKYHDGAPVLIGQVADVTLGPAPKRGTAADRAHDAVVLNIQKSPGTNTLLLTREIDRTLDESGKEHAGRNSVESSGLSTIGFHPAIG